MARRHIDQAEHREISDLFHHLILDSLLEAGDWTCDNLAFQGGTSLHLVWKSPRWSEDLDFLVDFEKRDSLEKVLVKVQKYVQAQCKARWPDCTVRLKGTVKPENKLSNFDLVWSDPSILEAVRTKVEFYAVKQELIRDYNPRLMLLPQGMMASVSGVVPAADREWVYHDKIHAIADRKFVKWRDLYDLWWLRTQSVDHDQRGLLPPYQKDDFLKRSTIVNAMYGSTPTNMIPGINKFLNIPESDLVTSAERDLKEWLPERLWKMMWPKQIEEIVRFVRTDLQEVLKVLEPTELTLNAPDTLGI